MDHHVPTVLQTLDPPKDLPVLQALDRVLRLLSMGSKCFQWFLTSQVDRSVTGLIARQ